MTAARTCGASVWRCGNCGTAVAPSKVRRGEGCPRPGCEDAEVVDGFCERRIAAGTVRCYRHGGSLTRAVEAATERRLEADVAGLLADREITPVTNPLTALSGLLGELTAVKDAFADRVEELNDITIVDQLGREDVRALLHGYERALDRLGRLLVDVARLNIDERLVRVDEATADLVIDLVDRLFTAVLAPGSISAARAWFAQAATAVQGGSVPPLPQLEPLTAPSVPVPPVQIPSAPVSSPERAGVEGHNVTVEPAQPVQAVTEPVGPDPDTTGDDSEALRAAERPPVTPPRHGGRIVKVSSTVGAGHPDPSEPAVYDSRHPNRGPAADPDTVLSADMWRRR